MKKSKLVPVSVAGRNLWVPARLTWWGYRRCPHQPVVQVLAGGYLPHPARIKAEGEGYATTPNPNPHFIRPVSPALMRWATQIALTLGIEGPQGEEWGSLEAFASRLKAWLLARPYLRDLEPRGGERLDLGRAAQWLLEHTGSHMRRLGASLGVGGQDYTPLALTLLGAARAPLPEAWLEERRAKGGKLAGQILALGVNHPQVRTMLRQARGVWAVHSAYSFVRVIIGSNAMVTGGPAPRRRTNPLWCSEGVLVASATSPRPEEREAYKAFLLSLVNIVDQEGEVEWIDPLYLYKKADEAFRQALACRGDLELRPAAAACLTVRIEAERARAGISLGRPASEEVYQILNLVWFLLGEFRSRGRLLTLEEAERALSGRFGVTLSPEAASEVAEYLAVSQGMVTFLDNPLDEGDGLTFSEVIPAEGAGPEEALERKEAEEEEALVRTTLSALAKALASSSSEAEARAMVGALWARHALGLEGASAIRRWVSSQRGMDPQALPAEDEDLLAMIRDLEVKFQVLYLATSRGWQVK